MDVARRIWKKATAKLLIITEFSVCAFAVVRLHQTIKQVQDSAHEQPKWANVCNKMRILDTLHVAASWCIMCVCAPIDSSANDLFLRFRRLNLTLNSQCITFIEQKRSLTSSIRLVLISRSDERKCN